MLTAVHLAHVYAVWTTEIMKVSRERKRKTGKDPLQKNTKYASVRLSNIEKKR